MGDYPRCHVVLGRRRTLPYFLLGVLGLRARDARDVHSGTSLQVEVGILHPDSFTSIEITGTANPSWRRQETRFVSAPDRERSSGHSKRALAVNKSR
jgi:hypothetical protein